MSVDHTDPTAAATQPDATSLPSDLQDERLQSRSGVRGTVQGFVDRTRSGDLGVLPVVAGLVVIWLVFQLLNPIFLSSRNLENLLMESVVVGVISLGIVGVLLVGQIDLSVGSVSGLSAGLFAVFFVINGIPWPVVVIGCLVAGALIGWFYSQMFNRFGVPSFVITLAGLLAFLGLQLYVLGKQGSINLGFDSGLVAFAQLDFVVHWLSYVLALLLAGGLFAAGFVRARARRRARLSALTLKVLALRSAALLAIELFILFILNQDRGIGWMVVLFISLVLALNYVLTRTSFGRSVFAVGGNAEAARRAGINVKLIRTSMFVLCSSFAALGGVLAAGRLGSSNQASGTGDVNLNAIAAAVIGGTSLFGGRGSAFAALLGIVVIQSISSGLTLLNLDSSFRFAVTGAVLLLAVALDSIARRSRVSHGRA